MNASLPTFPLKGLYSGRIPRSAFEPLIGVFYGLAMLSASTRLVLQLKFHRLLQLDDYILIFACICLTASTVLGYVNFSNLYWGEELGYDPVLFLYLKEEHVDTTAHVIAFHRAYYSYMTLIWATIFAVKFAYLAFSRRLVDRIRPLIIYWRITVGLSAVSFPVCVLSIQFGCLKKLEYESCLQSADFPVKVVIDTVLDILTDIMILGIPVYLVWSVRIQAHQKFIMGIFLSSNLFMALAAALRTSGFILHNAFDIVWLSVWQYVEACVAVIMISLTAFRSVYVSSRSLRARREPAKKPWYSNTVAAIRRKRNLNHKDEEFVPGLPTIPSATLTGMRTFIQGGRRTGTSLQTTNVTTTDEAEPEPWPLYERPVDNSRGKENLSCVACEGGVVSTECGALGSKRTPISPL